MYDIELIDVKGKANYKTDAMSRYPTHHTSKNMGGKTLENMLVARTTGCSGEPRL